MTVENADLAKVFLAAARKELLDHWKQLHDCVCSLTDEQVWWRPNDSSNSVGNLLLHLNGNVGQWIVASFNRADSGRNRPQEFSERGPTPASGLLVRLASTVEEAGAVLARVTPEELAATYEIQGKTVPGIEAILHSISHFNQHYGQIAYITKLLANRDLGFFRELNKTGATK